MSRKIALMVLGIIIIGLIALAVFAWSRPSSILPVAEQNPSLGTSRNEIMPSLPGSDNKKIIELPVSLASPHVGQVLIHYFFTGVIKELKNTPEGTQIIFDTKDQSLPRIIITSQVRIAKIAPPYSAQTSVPSQISGLKAGLTVDISAEYDPRGKQWMTRDVFIPTDRNP